MLVRPGYFVADSKSHGNVDGRSVNGQHLKVVPFPCTFFETLRGKGNVRPEDPHVPFRGLETL